MSYWAVQAKDEKGVWYTAFHGEEDGQLAVFFYKRDANFWLRYWRGECEDTPGTPTEFRIIELVEKE